MRKINKFEKLLKNRKMTLKKEYGVEEIGIFGSYVRGEDKRDSDLDVLVEFNKNACLGLLRFVHLENYLSELLGVKIDLVMKSALKPRIGRQILKEAIYL
ncbi:MAG: nucleotidyltransferase family protein [Elusimicrobia bacterium]|nr:nucleotidyltransferase family protein [Elusimicrobiota bacterium]